MDDAMATLLRRAKNLTNNQADGYFMDNIVILVPREMITHVRTHLSPQVQVGLAKISVIVDVK